MLIIGRFEQRRGPFRAAKPGRREHDRRSSRGHQPRGNFCFEAIDQQTTADRGPRRNGCLEPFDANHRVAGRRTGIEDEIGKVAEFFPVCPAAGRGVAVRARDDGDDANSMIPARNRNW